MEISFVSTLLASSDLALGRVGPVGLSLNGQQLVDDAEFFRAAIAQHYARGNVSTVLQFSSEWLLSSLKAAQVFTLTHAGSVPKSGIVTAVCGEAGDTQSVYLEDAVLESVSIGQIRGTAVQVQYTIRGGLWTTDVPPDLPGESEAAEDFIVMRRARVAIASGATTVAVTFSSPLTAVNSIQWHVAVPTGGAAITGTLLEDTVTTSGFTVRLDAETPNADYVLHYTAFE